MTNEQLQPREQQSHEQSETISESKQALDEQAIGRTFKQRQEDLEQVKQWVGLKFYYRAAEKVKAEEAALRKLLDREQIKQSILSEYSFVLDPLYFEQKFLNAP